MARRLTDIAVTEEHPATEARKAFSDLLNRVIYRQDRIVLTRRGKRIAAVISLEDLEALEALEDRADTKAALVSLRDTRTVPAAEVHAEIRRAPPARRPGAVSATKRKRAAAR